MLSQTDAQVASSLLACGSPKQWAVLDAPASPKVAKNSMPGAAKRRASSGVVISPAIGKPPPQGLPKKGRVKQWALRGETEQGKAGAKLRGLHMIQLCRSTNPCLVCGAGVPAPGRVLEPYACGSLSASCYTPAPACLPGYFQAHFTSCLLSFRLH